MLLHNLRFRKDFSSPELSKQRPQLRANISIASGCLAAGGFFVLPKGHGNFGENGNRSKKQERGTSSEDLMAEKQCVDAKKPAGIPTGFSYEVGSLSRISG